MNLRPLGYEPNELPGCSTPRQSCVWCVAPRTRSVTNDGAEFNANAAALIKVEVCKSTRCALVIVILFVLGPWKSLMTNSVARTIGDAETGPISMAITIRMTMKTMGAKAVPVVEYALV